MLVSWEYIKKRRKWTSEIIIQQLDLKSFKAFQDFFSSRGIECPPKDEYSDAIKKLYPPTPEVKPKVVSKPAVPTQKLSAKKTTSKTRRTRRTKGKPE
jgi:hypothetical protein